MKQLTHCAFAALLFVVSGCGPKISTLLDKNLSHKTDAEGIALMTLKTSNEHKTCCQPEVSVIRVTNLDSEEQIVFNEVKPYDKVKGEYNDYLISFKLTPGPYKVTSFAGVGKAFLVNGNFDYPLDWQFEVEAGKISYLGHMQANNRERGEDEDAPRSGPLLPILDQGASGFRGGTFDIAVMDQYEDDIDLFKSTYPKLQALTIEKGLLK